MDKIFKSASEINFVMRMANIIDDAVEIKRGIPASTIAISQIMDGRMKKTAAVSVDIILNLGKNLMRKGLNPVKVIAIIGTLYGLSSTGRAAINQIREWMHLDPHQKGDKADPYEHIDEPYKFEDTNIPNQSRTVSPGYYEPQATDEEWYQKMEGNKFWEAGAKSGIPAQFGIEPGFSVGGSPSTSSAFSDTIKKLRQNEQPITANSIKKMTALAQTGNFTSQSLSPMTGAEKLNPNVAGWINPTGWEQFMSQGSGPMGGGIPGELSGQWATQPSKESAFYDSSGTLGRTAPVEIKSPGAGQDFGKFNRLDLTQARLDAFNKLDPQRIAAESIFLYRQNDYLEQMGSITPQQAAINREMLTRLQQENNPEAYNQIKTSIQNAMTAGALALPNQQPFTPGVTSEQIDWENREVPEIGAKEQDLLNRLRKYEQNEMYRKTSSILYKNI